MNLLKDVILNGRHCSFEEYQETVLLEQSQALDSLGPGRGEWTVPEALKEKVADDGSFHFFYGDTVVAVLETSQASHIADLKKALERGLDFLAEPLETDTFHMTVHDLSNGRDQAALKAQMKANEREVRSIFQQLWSHFERFPEQALLKMRATNVFPCMNISLLLGLVPATEDDFKVLLNVYNLFDKVKYLDYYLRPHVTLAYFRPMPLADADIDELDLRMKKTNPIKMLLDFDLRNMIYQHFTSMNDYQSLYRSETSRWVAPQK